MRLSKHMMKTFWILILGAVFGGRNLYAQSELDRLPTGYFVITTGGQIITGTSGSFEKKIFKPNVVLLDSTTYQASTLSFFRVSQGCYARCLFGFAELVEEGKINRWFYRSDQAAFPNPAVSGPQVSAPVEYINKGLNSLKVFNVKNLKKVVADDPSSVKMIKRAATAKGLSYLGMGVGTLVTVLGGLALEDEDQENEELNGSAVATMVVGTGMVLGTIPLALSYKNKLYQVVDHYNEGAK